MPVERPLQIDIQREPGLAVVKVSGSATMDVSERLGDCLVKTAQDPIRMMVIDMAGLDFLCSESLGAIVSAYLKCVHRGGCVRLAGPTESIREILDLTKLNKLIPVFPSVEEAIQA